MTTNFLCGGENGEEENAPWSEGGIGDFHQDVKSLFKEHDILKASQDFFEKKIAITKGRGDT